MAASIPEIPRPSAGVRSGSPVSYTPCMPGRLKETRIEDGRALCFKTPGNDILLYRGPFAKRRGNSHYLIFWVSLEPGEAHRRLQHLGTPFVDSMSVAGRVCPHKRRKPVAPRDLCLGASLKSNGNAAKHLWSC